MKNHKFYDLLHARKMNTTKLAALIQSGRAHVTDVINNRPGHGYRTRRKLVPHLTDAEIAALGWDFADERKHKPFTAHGKKAGIGADGGGAPHGDDETQRTNTPHVIDSSDARCRSTGNIVSNP